MPLTLGACSQPSQCLLPIHMYAYTYCKCKGFGQGTEDGLCTVILTKHIVVSRVGFSAGTSMSGPTASRQERRGEEKMSGWQLLGACGLRPEMPGS